MMKSVLNGKLSREKEREKKSIYMIIPYEIPHVNFRHERTMWKGGVKNKERKDVLHSQFNEKIFACY